MSDCRVLQARPSLRTPQAVQAQTRWRLQTQQSDVSALRALGRPATGIASESPPIDKDRETGRREGCGLAQNGSLTLVAR